MSESPQISFLYNGEVRVEFRPDNKRSRYKVFDKDIQVKPSPVSVTTVTGIADFGKSQALQGWAIRMAMEVLRDRIKPDQIHGAQFLEEAFADAQANYRNVKKAAADVGTQAHYALERYFSGDPDHAPPLSGTPVRACYDSALDWYNQRQIETVCNEARVYSRTHKVIGTLDHLAKVDQVPSLVDFKASKHVYSSYVMQISAYVHIWEEMNPSEPRIEQAYLLQLGEVEATPFLFNREQLDTAYEAFLGLLRTYEWNRKLGELKPVEKDWADTL